MIEIIEVGPRDGLQNESVPVPTEVKVQFIKQLLDAGLKEIEVTSFVSAKWVPQLADAEEVLASLPKGPLYSALVPNPKGLDRALDTGIERISLFTAASEAFTLKNINRTIEQSLEDCRIVIDEFRSAVPQGFIRAYVSTAFECPYAGIISPSQTTDVAMKLLELGADEIAIGDTIGVASPREVKALTELLINATPANKLAYHFHDTRGTALANIAAAMEFGVTRFDSAAAGLGGCPYAKGAGGNLATEDLLYFLNRQGHETGVDLEGVALASLPILNLLQRMPSAKVQVAVLAN